MRIRHTVILTLKPDVPREQVEELIDRLNKLGEHATNELGVTDWVVAEQLPETFREFRGHILQDGIFPDLKALEAHGPSPAHKRVKELTTKFCEWKVIDTWVE